MLALLRMRHKGKHWLRASPTRILPDMDPIAIDRLQFGAHSLMSGHRPAWRHQNKSIVYEVACPRGSIHGGNLTYTRWQRALLPDDANPPAAADRVAPRAGFYDYEAERDLDATME